MGGCSAANCRNHSRKGFRMFRFPKASERRKRWIINCGRGNWEPGLGAQLCSDHFDEDQFEKHRQDNLKKLKQDAIPTIFKRPNASSLSSNRNLLEEVLEHVHYVEKLHSSETTTVPYISYIRYPVIQENPVHFEETQFELHRQDGWKKLKPNAIPTIFPDPPESPKKREKSTVSRKRKVPGEDSTSVVPRKKSKRNSEISQRKKKLGKRKASKSKSQAVQRKKNSSSNSTGNDSVLKKKQGSESTANSQKENVSPRNRKCKKPYTVSIPESDSATEEEESGPYITEIEEEEEDSEDEEAQQQIALLKQENESMKQEIAEFEKHNKAMARVILELEKHNKLMSLKLTELDKDNKVLNKKVSDLERLNEDLKSKLNCCFSEEQFARMEKMRQLGTIERYIPALK